MPRARNWWGEKMNKRVKPIMGEQFDVTKMQEEISELVEGVHDRAGEGLARRAFVEGRSIHWIAQALHRDRRTISRLLRRTPSTPATIGGTPVGLSVLRSPGI